MLTPASRLRLAADQDLSEFLDELRENLTAQLESLTPAIGVTEHVARCQYLQSHLAFLADFRLMLQAHAEQVRKELKTNG